MATTGYITRMSGNEIIDKEARDKIKELQGQVQALRICVLAIVRGLKELNAGNLIQTSTNTFEKDIASSASQLAFPGGSHGNYTTLNQLLDFGRGLFYFYNNSYNNRSLYDLIQNYYQNFGNSTDNSSGTVNTKSLDSNIF